MGRPKGSKNKKTLEKEKQASFNTQESVPIKVCTDSVLLGAETDVTDSTLSLSETEAN